VFFVTLQTTNRVKEKYFSIYAKRRIHIISFFNSIQEKDVGRQRKAKR
jgi:hypothetical protein